MRRHLDDDLAHLLARAELLVSETFQEELRRRRLAVPVWRVLASLQGGQDGETVSALAAACLQQQPTMTKLLARMARDGLVRRVPDETDRRAVRIWLTPQGQSLAADLVRLAQRHEAALAARHPAGALRSLKVLLRGLLEGKPPAGGRDARPGAGVERG
jgi:DNA-binding MarR family transcriptional regulator